MSSTADRTLKALERRIIELEAWRNKRVSPLGTVYFQADGREASVSVPIGHPWPRRSVPVRMRLPVTIPSDWAGESVRLELDVGGEALVRLNGRPLGGLPSPVPDGSAPRFGGYQREYELVSPAAGKETESPPVFWQASE